MSAEPRLVPTLDELVRDPCLATDLPQPEAVRLLAQVGALEAVLQARLAAPGESAVPGTPASVPPCPRLLTAEQAATRLNVTVRWLRDHGQPFRVRLSPRRIRYSEALIERYLRRLV